MPGQFNIISTLAFTIHWLIRIYIFIIIARSVLSWTGDAAFNPTFVYYLKRLTDPVFRLAYRYCPFCIIGNMDISPILIIILLSLIDSMLAQLFFRLAPGLAPAGL